jgi:hypothetical protein
MKGNGDSVIKIIQYCLNVINNLYQNL